MTDASPGPVPGLRHAFELRGPGPAGSADLAAAAALLRRGARQATATTGHRPILRDRWWFLIVFLVALTVFGGTDVGRVIFDTKLGVDVNAGEFLGRLWSLWNPLEWFGTLQDQYIGYAIPMAPFFLVGQLAHVPVWLIERIWLSLLLAVGFTGMVKLARALRIGNEPSRLLAGAVFILWPTYTIVIGSTSAAALPGLVVPWAILPLISAADGQTSTSRAAARSGIAVAAMAGVNAVSTLAVLLLPALYILTHTRGGHRIRLSLAWCAAVVAATAWWVIPLLLQGHYSFNFLPFIEQASTTSGTMSAAASLRGAGTWTAYLNLGGVPWLPAGWIMVTSSAAILASAAASAAGLAGLARRDMPDRRWLCSCAGLVVAIALAGYYGPLGGPFHASVDSLLNGPLAPFRSTYKFEPVLAVVLALGFAHLIQRCWQLRLTVSRSVQLTGAAMATPLVVLVLAGLAMPQLTGQILQPGSFQSLPSYWSQAAAYLAAHSAREPALIVPANAHGQFTWGDTIDDPLETLATSPWVERGLVPYGGAGSQAVLATAEQALESGQQVPGLAAFLARAGVRYVAVRNDVSPEAIGYTAPQAVNETLVESGFRRVAAFGPTVPGAPSYPRLAGLPAGFAPSYPSIEIFAPASPDLHVTGPATVLPTSQTALVSGGPDALLQLEGRGVLGSRPAVIAGDRLPVAPALWADTDGQRRADYNFGSTSNSQSFTYTATEVNPPDDPLGGGNGPPRQLLPVSAASHQTVAVLAGAESVTASSAGTWLSESPQYAPANAFDNNPATAWTEASPATPVGQWIQINFGRDVNLPTQIGIRLLEDSATRSIANQLRVTTASGSAATDTVATGSVQQIGVKRGWSRWLRITITGANNVVPGNPGAGISDVLIPGVTVSSYLETPTSTVGAKAPADAYSFTQQLTSPYGQDGPPAGTALDRIFTTPANSGLYASITAVPDPGPALESLIAGLTPRARSDFWVSASSIWDSLPALGPANLFEPGTSMPWLAGAADPQPRLEIRWRGRRTIREIVLQPAYGLAAAPISVLVGSPAGVRLANVGLGGVVQINPPLRTSKLYLAFPAVSSGAAGNTAAGQPGQLPPGLARIRIPGLTGLHLAAPSQRASFRLSCGAGPQLIVDGRRYETSVSGTLADLIQLSPVQLRLCAKAGALRLPAGRHVLSAVSTPDFIVANVTLTSTPAETSPNGRTRTTLASRNLQVVSWQADNRELRVGSGSDSYLEIHENFNPGWSASLNGRNLTSVRLDGWQQAFILPAGHGGTVTLTFAPAQIYHAGIIAAALALLVLAAVAVGPWRRRRPRARLRRSSCGNGPSPSHVGVGPPRQPALVLRRTTGQESPSHLIVKLPTASTWAASGARRAAGRRARRLAGRPARCQVELGARYQ